VQQFESLQEKEHFTAIACSTDEMTMAFMRGLGKKSNTATTTTATTTTAAAASLSASTNRQQQKRLILLENSSSCGDSVRDLGRNDHENSISISNNTTGDQQQHLIISMEKVQEDTFERTRELLKQGKIALEDVYESFGVDSSYK